MLNASAAAMRTHQQEKLEALRAAVINTALGMAPDEHKQLKFIGFAVDLTALHLRVLSYGHDPADWFERNHIPKPDVCRSSGVGSQQALYDQLTSPLGDRFLAFITMPSTTDQPGRMELEIELVPTPLWRESLYRLLTRGQSDTIREPSLDRAAGRFEVCGHASARLLCHEQWHYDDATRIRTLTGIQAVCQPCSSVMHIGRSSGTCRWVDLQFSRHHAAEG